MNHDLNDAGDYLSDDEVVYNVRTHIEPDGTEILGEVFLQCRVVTHLVVYIVNHKVNHK